MSESFEDARAYLADEVDRHGQAARAPDRLPPHSPEAEQGVIGCCLLSPMECIPQVVTRTNDNPEVCYDPRHTAILAQLFCMFQNNVPVDIITLCQRLKDFAMLEEVGGTAYLNSLADAVSSPANLPTYLGIVLDKHLARKGIQTCQSYVEALYDTNGEISRTMDELERDVLLIRRDVVVSESSGMKELIPEAVNEIEAAFNRSGQLSGLATGFADLDHLTSGLQKGEMVILAARPSCGKTSLMCNIAEHVALELKLPVGIFSLETTKRSLTTRILTSRARVNLRNIRDGFMAQSDFPRLTSAAGKLAHSLIRIDDTAGLSIMSLRARARSMWQQYGIKLFEVDYLQLLHSTTKRARENRQLEIAEVSAGVKALAKELDVPVLVLSQLNRNIERDRNRKPKLSDLRESGAIEQDADVVAFLYKPRLDEDEDWQPEEPDGVPVDLHIAKQRNGPVGTVHLTFLKPYTRFESAARLSDQDAQLPYRDE